VEELPAPPRITDRDRMSAVRPHEIIVQWLRRLIEDGRYFEPMVDPLPGELWLSTETGAARDTVRRAVAVLRDEGLVVTLPQRGTYVTEEAARIVKGQRGYVPGVGLPRKQDRRRR
jgi:GntR family transcriptional regulator